MTVKEECVCKRNARDIEGEENQFRRENDRKKERDTLNVTGVTKSHCISSNNSKQFNRECKL